jgi:hypothetical protein
MRVALGVVCGLAFAASIEVKSDPHRNFEVTVDDIRVTYEE